MQRAANGRWKRTGVENLWLNRNGFYYARYRVAGKPTWKSLRTKLKSAANVRWQDVDFKGGFLVVRGDPETGTKNWEIRLWQVALVE